MKPTLPTTRPTAFCAALFSLALFPHTLRAESASTSLSRAGTGDSAILRYADPPVLTPALVATGDDAVWSASVDCASPVDLASLIGAQVRFTFDRDLDGVGDAADSLGISPADCGESEPGRIVLRRRFRDSAGSTSPVASVMRANLTTPGASLVATHAGLVRGIGSLLKITRYCARPQNGEPEWIEVRNVAGHSLALSRVRLEGRAFSGHIEAGRIESGEGILVGSDTAELRIWQPGGRILGLTSWSNLRNSGDTLRLMLEDGLALDSVIYGPSLFPLEQCASQASEGSGAAAAGYAVEFSALRWSQSNFSTTPFSINVRAPLGGRYDLIVYDLDGRPLCSLARNSDGPTTYLLPSALCPALDRTGSGGAGRVILHLSPRNAPGVRALLRIAP